MSATTVNELMWVLCGLPLMMGIAVMALAGFGWLMEKCGVRM